MNKRLFGLLFICATIVAIAVYVAQDVTRLIGLGLFLVVAIAIVLIAHIIRDIRRSKKGLDLETTVNLLGSIVIPLIPILIAVWAITPREPLTEPTPTAISQISTPALPPTEAITPSPINTPVPTETPTPTEAPTVTPTPYKPKTPQEKVLRDYLEARKLQQHKIASELISKYSMELFRVNQQDVIKSLDDTASKAKLVDYTIMESRPINHKKAEAILIFAQLTTENNEGKKETGKYGFTIIQEDGQWRINANNLIDYLELDVPQAIEHGVIVKSLRVIRFDNAQRIVYSVNNTNTNRAVLLDKSGFAASYCAAHFEAGDPPPETCGLKLFPNEEKVFNFPIEGLQESYPTGFDIYGWELSMENSFEFWDWPIKPWSYQFKFKYVP